MADEFLVIDLFGDAVQATRDGRGRPEHPWSIENSNRVLLCFARQLSMKETAKVVGISVPTLRKVYFSECAKRREARLRMEMAQLVRLNRAAEAGAVAAEKELFKQLDRLRQRDQVQAASPAPTAKPEKLGKKAAARAAAERVSGLYEPPPAPQLIN